MLNTKNKKLTKPIQSLASAIEKIDLEKIESLIANQYKNDVKSSDLISFIENYINYTKQINSRFNNCGNFVENGIRIMKLLIENCKENLSEKDKDGNNVLMKALQSSKLSDLKEQKTQFSENITCKYEENFTILKYSFINLLIEHDINLIGINQQNSDGHNILMLAADQPSSVFQLLYDKINDNACIKHKDNNGNNILMHALGASNFELISYLYKNFEENVDVNDENNVGDNALFYLAKLPSKDHVYDDSVYYHNCIAKLNDINQQDKHGKTIIMYALEKNNFYLISCILKFSEKCSNNHGCVLNCSSSKLKKDLDFTVEDKSCYNTLMYLAKIKFDDLNQYLKKSNNILKSYREVAEIIVRQSYLDIKERYKNANGTEVKDKTYNFVLCHAINANNIIFANFLIKELINKFSMNGVNQMDIQLKQYCPRINLSPWDSSKVFFDLDCQPKKTMYYSEYMFCATVTGSDQFLSVLLSKMNSEDCEIRVSIDTFYYTVKNCPCMLLRLINCGMPETIHYDSSNDKCGGVNFFHCVVKQYLAIDDISKKNLLLQSIKLLVDKVRPNVCIGKDTKCNSILMNVAVSHDAKLFKIILNKIKKDNLLMSLHDRNENGNNILSIILKKQSLCDDDLEIVKMLAECDQFLLYKNTKSFEIFIQESIDIINQYNVKLINTNNASTNSYQSDNNSDSDEEKRIDCNVRKDFIDFIKESYSHDMKNVQHSFINLVSLFQLAVNVALGDIDKAMKIVGNNEKTFSTKETLPSKKTLPSTKTKLMHDNQHQKNYGSLCKETSHVFCEKSEFLKEEFINLNAVNNSRAFNDNNLGQHHLDFTDPNDKNSACFNDGERDNIWDFTDPNDKNSACFNDGECDNIKITQALMDRHRCCKKSFCGYLANPDFFDNMNTTEERTKNYPHYLPAANSCVYNLTFEYENEEEKEEEKYCLLNQNQQIRYYDATSTDNTVKSSKNYSKHNPAASSYIYNTAFGSENAVEGCHLLNQNPPIKYNATATSTDNTVKSSKNGSKPKKNVGFILFKVTSVDKTEKTNSTFVKDAQLSQEEHHVETSYQ